MAAIKTIREEWTKSERDILVGLWLQSETDDTIAERLDRSSSSVQSYAMRIGLPMRTGVPGEPVDVRDGKLRKCMCCPREFWSTWKGNRMCVVCIENAI